ncbi:hypothetical protein BJ322DRAFT_837976 [Thelephora terrestris]|uniref:F-box domain-containing protein n=1 Tax=Thelephora terrestris TaxID=56493 RepID=A0A9P6HHN6_9AGAM|nr:hypothetical protein BJ322DRAFT_837976 [Thelephora terrestris]
MFSFGRMIRFLRSLRRLRSSKPPAVAPPASSESAEHTRGGISEPAADLCLMLANYVGGFKDLPLEIVDEILEHLADDRSALGACSLTCKALFCSSRPIIHRRIFVVGMGGSHTTGEQAKQAANLARFRTLLAAAECGLARYARDLTIRMGTTFEPENLQPFLPQFQKFARLNSLTLHNFNPTPFLPAFEQYFGHLAQQIQSFKFIYPSGAQGDMISFISRFPNLDDLEFCSFPRLHSEEFNAHSVQTSPTLRGTLQTSVSFDRVSPLCGDRPKYRNTGVQFHHPTPAHVTDIAHALPGLDLSACSHLQVFEVRIEFTLFHFHEFTMWLVLTIGTIASPEFHSIVLVVQDAHCPKLFGEHHPQSALSLVDLTLEPYHLASATKWNKPFR